MTAIPDRLAALTESLIRDGLLDPSWGEAFTVARRDLFVPEVIWIPDDEKAGRLRRCERRAEPEAWADRVVGLHPVNVQVDDGHPAGPEGTGTAATSGISDPRVVAGMLTLLDAQQGLSCLEVGTGPGWNAGLLAARLGPANVVTVEVDDRVAALARGNLARAGLASMVVTGDGADGYLPRAPYDRIIATCAVSRVPYSWVMQARPGAVIVLPLALGWGDCCVTVRLTVDAAGIATGRIARATDFMAMRAQRVRHRTWTELTAGAGDPVFSTTDLDPCAIDEQWVQQLVFSVRVPGAEAFWDEEAEVLHVGTWQAPPGRGSFARVRYGPENGPWRVEQRGPRRLWHEVQAAHTWWLDHGKPALTAFGLTVTSADDQCLWYDTPDGPAWPLAPLPLVDTP